MPRRTPTQTAPAGQRGDVAGEESALAAIVRSSHDAVIAKTLTGIVTSWNDGAHVLYGYPAEAMVGRSIETTFPLERLAEERARHERVARGESESGYRCIRIRSDGQPLEVVMSMSPIRSAQGDVVGVASISRPVSDKEHAEGHFASLLEAAPDAIVCIDVDGRIAMVNKRVVTVFGYPPAELVGLPMGVVIPEATAGGNLLRHVAAQRSAQTRSKVPDLELTGRRRDGSTFPVEVSLATSGGGGGGLVIAVVRDVTQRRAVENALRESEARFRQLAESVDIVFILRQLDPPLYLYVSPACRSVLGCEPEELLADPTRGAWLIHPDDRERFDRDYLQPSRSGQIATSEHRIMWGDGSTRWIRTASTPVSDPSGHPSRAVVTVEDITERMNSAEALQQAETSARRANDAKSEFLSRMSHELRTPLNAVLGFGQLLERQLAGTAHAEAISHILKGGRHLLALINDVLDIARIEAGEMSVSTEPVQIVDLIDEVVALMRPLADSAGVSLTSSSAPAELYALADRQRLRQIILNLLSNAVKYNRVGGSVWVAVARAGPHELILSVRDDGPGIPADLHDRVFTAFDRLGAETKDVEGTGIGLALTRSLAELMGGSITLSDEPRGGCCFNVTLRQTPRPLSATRLDGPSPDLPPLDRTATAGPTTTATVLYIEDNEPNVRVVAHLLQLRPWWSLIHAGRGGLGLELAEAHRPDIILLDLHLPDQTGHAVLSALKGNPLTRAIPVAVLSADANITQAPRLIAAGAIRFLTKPLDIDEVLSLLDEIDAGKVGSRG